MSLRLKELNPDIDYKFVCTPTGDELPEMVDHWVHLQTILQTKLTVLSSGFTLKTLIEHHAALPNWRYRWCTRQLKIEPFQTYILTQTPCTVYVGIRADEPRDGALYDSNEITQCFPMVDWGWGKKDVLYYLQQRGVTIPVRTDCGMCFYQTLWEWYQLYLNYPDKYNQAMFFEQATKHTFRSPSRDTWPTSLQGLAIMFMHGHIPQKRNIQDRTTMCGTCAR